MSALLESVQFNHAAYDKRGSALNLRVNFNQPIPKPEWQRLADGSVLQAPAAYATRIIVSSLLAVGARIRWTGAPRKSIEVRALQATAGQAAGPSVLGELAARVCTLGRDGTTGLMLFAVRGGWLPSAPVGTHQIAWRWQYRTGAGAPWNDFAQSGHQVFTTLLPPSAPWSGAPVVAANTSLLWSDVLGIACEWAAGANTTDEAAALVCQRLFSLGGSLFEYGCPVFGREMYSSSPLAIFDCSAAVERLNGGPGNGRYVNCSDCACIVSTLANALGASLWQGRMGEYVPAFNTRDIRTIGGSQWTSPCNTGLGFMFHEVAWSGDATDLDSVYDASLMVNTQLSPFGAITPLLAADFTFGLAWGGLYRSMLAASKDQLVCHPRPEERRCRALV